MTTVLEVRSVGLSFGGVRALQDVSFEVTRGEVFAVIGPNGAGKTSLFNALTGVFPPVGAVVHEGDDIVGERPHEIASRGVGRTFQNLGLFESMNVVENVLVGRHRLSRGGVMSGAVWWGRARSEERRARLIAEQVIEMLDLGDYRTDIVESLPYGIKKRVELARVLASEPELLLLDEPVAGMNREEKVAVEGWLRRIHSELGLTMLLVEHDMKFVMSLADRVMVLDQGQRIALGMPSEVRADPKVIRAYLGGASDSPDTSRQATSTGVVALENERPVT